MTAESENRHRPDDSTGSQSERLFNGAPIRVLVVDDSRASADALSAYLQAGGMSVRTVYHGSDALREAKAWIPDCIVLDVAMPGLSGIGVAAALRRIETTGKIPLLAYTAFDTADRIREMKEVGFDVVCRKPAELTQLEGMIFKLVSHEAVDDFRVASSPAEFVPPDAGLDTLDRH
ncbi:response regulator [Paraburkholderia ginsengisoli]|uniref:Response regulator n=1 Tax=Paraburkholderia ginsengisoli TaxID=311231 RepID=A0A7T4N832_9BURK|nr:response regulator [Paraburkholderia ginsengisoli]QQC66941.1 response regulator [Paraburkholderia ginsengisoli]